MPRQAQYDDALKAIYSLCDGEDDSIALMASISCELFHGIDGFDWVGFYRVTEPNILKIGPYQGNHGCLVIPFARGVCGAAATQRRTMIVDDVDAFPGHIACASSTRSEIVCPVLNADGSLIAVLDIDSNQPRHFDVSDQNNLEQMLNQVFSKKIVVKTSLNAVCMLEYCVDRARTLRKTLPYA